MSKKHQQKTYLKPNEVAELLRVEPGTIRVWAQSGKLKYSTTLGGHRRFTYRDVEAFARANGLSIAAPEGEKLRVLVVDDDQRVARLIKRMIATGDESAEIELAADGFAAGTAVIRNQPHIIVLDLFMPGIDGFELCKNLKSDPETQDIRIVAVTGQKTPETEERILGLGAEACLGKPVDKKELLKSMGLAS